MLVAKGGKAKSTTRRSRRGSGKKTAETIETSAVVEPTQEAEVKTEQPVVDTVPPEEEAQTETPDSAVASEENKAE